MKILDEWRQLLLRFEPFMTDPSQGLKSFYTEVRCHEWPFLPCAHTGPTADLYHLCFNGLYEVGRVSIGVGVGLTMHQYMLAALATFPLPKGDENSYRRQLLLESIQNGKFLVANTGSDERTRSQNDRTSGTQAVRTQDGFLIHGKKTFVSLAAEADLLIFTAEIPSEGLAAFITPLAENEAIQLLEPSFAPAMVAAGTRSVSFSNLFVPASASLVMAEEASALSLHAYQRAWFQALIPAVYLGASSRALDEAARFAHAFQLAENQSLSSLDGIVAEFGRLQIQQKMACEICYRAGQRLAELSACPQENISAALDTAAIAKYIGTTQAEAIVQAVRRMVGTRAMFPDNILERLSREIVYGPLHPIVQAQFERHMGQKLLEKK